MAALVVPDQPIRYSNDQPRPASEQKQHMMCCFEQAASSTAGAVSGPLINRPKSFLRCINAHKRSRRTVLLASIISLCLSSSLCGASTAQTKKIEEIISHQQSDRIEDISTGTDNDRRYTKKEYNDDYGEEIAKLMQLHYIKVPQNVVPQQTALPATTTATKRRKRNSGGRGQVCSIQQLNARCAACQRQARSKWKSRNCSTYFLGRWSCKTNFRKCRNRKLKKGCRNARRKLFRRCEMGDVTKPLKKQGENLVSPYGETDCSDIDFEDFYEEFEAEIVIDCDDNDDEKDDVQLSPELDEAFAKHFQEQEDCGIYDDGDFDGCGVPTREVVFSSVEKIIAGKCEDADLTTPSTGNRDLQAQKTKGRKRKKKRLKMRGRNGKRGKCRRKCASRNKKADDAIGDPSRRFLRDVVAPDADRRRKLIGADDPVGICTADAEDEQGQQAPDLVATLNEAEFDEGTNFTTRQADITKVVEYKCSGPVNNKCNDGSHMCCGVAGCSCSSDKITDTSCKVGTIIPKEGNRKCFLSPSGLFGDENLCCDPITYAKPCRDECGITDAPTSAPTDRPSPQPSSSPTVECDLEFSEKQSYNQANENIDILLTVENLCPAETELYYLNAYYCVRCVGERERRCPTEPESIFYDLVYANDLSNVIPADTVRDVQLSRQLDDKSREGVACEYITVIDYEATAYLPSSGSRRQFDDVISLDPTVVVAPGP